MSWVDLILGIFIAVLLADRIRLEGRITWLELGWHQKPQQEESDE